MEGARPIWPLQKHIAHQETDHQPFPIAPTKLKAFAPMILYFMIDADIHRQPSGGRQ
jgi:hypothetical protein